MTTEAIIIHIFFHVDNAMLDVLKEGCAKLYPSEVVTIGILLALKDGHFRAFYGYHHTRKHRWLKRDFDQLFGGLPDRSALLRQLRIQQQHTDLLMAQPSVLNVVDAYQHGGNHSFPIELIFPIREGRSAQQFGEKSKDKGRWSVGVKLCWILNTFGQVCGWIWDTMNCSDNAFLDFFEEYDGEAVLLADWGFRCADDLPPNVKLCKKGTWNDRRVVETSFSMITVVCKAQKIHHRLEAYIEARLPYTVAMFNICLKLFHQLHPEESVFKMSIAEFSL